LWGKWPTVSDGINTAMIKGSRGTKVLACDAVFTGTQLVYDQLIKSGRVKRAQRRQLSEELGTNQITLKSLGAPYGVVIEGVSNPAARRKKAGLIGAGP